MLTLELSPLPSPLTPVSSQTYHLPPPPPQTLHLTLPSTSGRLHLAPSRILHQTRAKWLAAFEQSFLHTVQASSPPAEAGERVVLIGHTPPIGPVPRSPSMLGGLPLASRHATREGGSGKKEEERAWWDARFRTVRSEMMFGDGGPTAGAGTLGGEGLMGIGGAERGTGRSPRLGGGGARFGGGR